MMFLKAKTAGERGEDIAAKWYRHSGYEIVARNYRTRLGEIDLIVQKNGELVFAEVKARSAGFIATPASFVTPSKQRKLILAAQSYLSALKNADGNMRFDVVEVFLDNKGKDQVHCIENAFTL